MLCVESETMARPGQPSKRSLILFLGEKETTKGLSTGTDDFILGF